MRITALYIHPVKSCAAVAVTKAEVGRRGLTDDRRFMIVDANGRFLSQRTHPRMALLVAELSGDQLVLRDRANQELGELRVPRVPLARGDAPRRAVTVWRDTMDALALPESEAWLTRALGKPATLVYQPEETLRVIPEDRAGRTGDEVSFADGYPCLLTSETSLADVAARVGAPLEMTRFRPNVVVDGGAPFEEESLRTVLVGSVLFRHAKPCERCTVPNVDPTTGESGSEPIRTLAGYRAKEGAVFFGINLIPETLGEIRVGDEVLTNA